MSAFPLVPFAFVATFGLNHVMKVLEAEAFTHHTDSVQTTHEKLTFQLMLVHVCPLVRHLIGLHYHSHPKRTDGTNSFLMNVWFLEVSMPIPSFILQPPLSDNYRLHQGI